MQIPRDLMFFSLGLMPRSGIARLCDEAMFTFIRNYHALFSKSLNQFACPSAMPETF